MSRNEQAVRIGDVADHPLRHASGHARETEPRTIVIRQGSGWQSLAFLCLCLLLLAVVVLGHRALAALEGRSHDTALAMARFERKVQHVESGLAFEARQRQLLLGMRDHILRVNGRVSLGDAYRYAELALRASEKYPAVDPLLLLAIGTVESRFDQQARSHANARGLYQIWPATGRLLLRGLGWDYDEAALYDPEKNTEAAALYLDILFATYGDPEMVLAEYNGGPLNAGYLRAGVAALAAETRNYVPQVLAQYARLKEQFEAGTEIQAELMHRDGRRQAKTLTTAAAAGRPPSATEPRREGSASLPAPPSERAAPGRPAR